MIGLVTDSNAQLPADLRERFGVHVVPLVVVVDGAEYAEGIDLDDDDFYSRLAAGATVSTAAPSPGRFVEAYRAVADAGATEILSVHIGSNTSATIDAAAIAARMSPVPVEIVDTGTASFPIACCVWAAALTIDAGGGLDDAARAALAVAEHVDNVFVVGALDLARRGGRLAAGAYLGDGLPVLALHGGVMDVVALVDDIDGAIEAMAGYLHERAGGVAQLVGVGHAGAAELAEALAARLDALDEVTQLVRYTVGPSVGAHTGLGTAGCVFFAADLASGATLD